MEVNPEDYPLSTGSAASVSMLVSKIKCVLGWSNNINSSVVSTDTRREHCFSEDDLSNGGEEHAILTDTKIVL